MNRKCANRLAAIETRLDWLPVLSCQNKWVSFFEYSMLDRIDCWPFIPRIRGSIPGASNLEKLWTHITQMSWFKWLSGEMHECMLCA